MGSSKQVRFSDTHDIAEAEILIIDKKPDISDRVAEMKMKLAKQKLRQQQQEDARVIESEMRQIIADEKERDRNRKLRQAILLNEKQRQATVLRETASVVRKQRERRRENDVVTEIARIEQQIAQQKARKVQLAEERASVNELLIKTSPKVVRGGRVLYSI
eukprot:TRINITY_DN1697_c5_g1_i1.p1 TRINITY_DN1697_c5_g1~~TRINITY_DN1697_c5_g1_i1.p1  ORF type:complete len:161 (+),score=40.98 TRINITY_DN1697_c5_g1_i1:105-587(+)